MTERLHRAGRLSWAIVGIAALVALVIAVLWTVRVVFPPLVLAAAIVFVLNPVVTMLQRRGIPRAVGAGISYLAVISIASIVMSLLIPLAATQARDLGDDWPTIRGRAERWIDARAAESEGTFFEFDRAALEDAFTGDSSLTSRLGRARRITAQVFHVLLILLLAPVLAFYLLVDLPHIRRVSQSLIPAGAKQEVLAVARKFNRAVGGFFRGQLLVALIVGILCSIGLAAIGLKFWFLVGMIAGLFNIIPLIGPWIGGIPGVVIALTTGSTLQAVLVVVVMAGAQQIDNHFITPYVMQRAVRLHPVAVILALVAGGSLAGFFGLLFAVPAAAMLKILLSHLWRVHVLGEPIDGADEGDTGADGDGAAAGEDEEPPGTGFVEDVITVPAASER